VKRRLTIRTVATPGGDRAAPTLEPESSQKRFVTLAMEPELRMSALTEILIFAAKAMILATAVIVIVAAIARSARRSDSGPMDRLEITPLHTRLREASERIEREIAPEAARKALDKARNQRRKAALKAAKGERERPRVFVLDFQGDVRASAVRSLRDEITAVLQVARTSDEVVIRLESPGGVVHGYGLAASQLDRIRQRGIRLTVAVDKVAASGGYLMACVADRIIAAPFAIIGSIGVVMQIPNFHRLLQHNNIDFEMHTAGEFKRTLTLFGENTEEGRAKLRAELEDTHALFKEYVAEHRPQLELATVATGEHWFGRRALALNLVDELMTSDDYLLNKITHYDVFRVRIKTPKPLLERLTQKAALAFRGNPAALASAADHPLSKTHMR
jgi:serine protease SohB